MSTPSAAADPRDAPWRGVGSDERRCLDRRPLRTRLALPPADVAAAVRAEGLLPARTDGLACRLDAADVLIDVVPDLAAVVRRVVARVHPLASEPGYDISHSQPRWPDRIFVSFPERDDVVGAARLAEGVVHEAMHLLLTEEERERPLVADDAGRLWSPWMGMDRHAGGVLHGIFVFLCIRSFLSRLAPAGRAAGPLAGHCGRRLSEIDGEIAVIDRAELARSLTPRGLELLAIWSPGHGSRDARAPVR